MSPRSQTLPVAQLLEQHLPSVWAFCSRMTLATVEAERATYETFQRASAADQLPSDAAAMSLWLLKIAAFVTQGQVPPEAEVDFDLLDETLRSEATRTQEVASITKPEREFLLWQLKQGCMTSVINCLSPGEREAFVLSSVMGKSDEQAAQVLDIKVSAFKVRLSRARKKIGDYLAPRCEHVDPRNPCHCPSRIGVALRKGFIAPPQPKAVQLRAPDRPFDQEIRSPDATAIFRSLPQIEMPERLRTLLEQSATTGTWAPYPEK